MKIYIVLVLILFYVHLASSAYVSLHYFGNQHDQVDAISVQELLNSTDEYFKMELTGLQNFDGQFPPYVKAKDLEELNDYRVLHESGLEQGHFALACEKNSLESCSIYYLKNEANKTLLYVKTDITDKSEGVVLPINVSSTYASDPLSPVKIAISSGYLIVEMRPNEYVNSKVEVVFFVAPISNLKNLLESSTIVIVDKSDPYNRNHVKKTGDIEKIGLNGPYNDGRTYLLVLGIKNSTCQNINVKLGTRYYVQIGPISESPFSQVDAFDVDGVEIYIWRYNYPFAAFAESNSISASLNPHTHFTNALSVTEFIDRNHSCQMRKIQLKHKEEKYIVVYCKSTGILTRFNFSKPSDLQAPSNAGFIKVDLPKNNSEVFFGNSRFVYFTSVNGSLESPTSYRLIIFDAAAENMTLRFDQELPLRKNYHKAPLISAFAIDFDTEVFLVYGGETGLFRISKDQQILVIIPGAHSIDWNWHYGIGSFEFEFSLSLQPYNSTQDNIALLNSMHQNNISISMLYTSYALKAQAATEETNLSQIYPASLFSGPVFSLELELFTRPPSNCKISFSGGLFEKESVVPSVLYRSQIVATAAYKNKLYILERLDYETLALSLINMNSSSFTKQDMENQTTVSYVLEGRSLTSLDITKCGILPLEINSREGFILNCPVVRTSFSTAPTMRTSLYYTMIQDNIRQAHKRTDDFDLTFLPQNRFGENLLINVFDPTENDGKFISSVFFEIQGGIIREEVTLKARYSNILYPNGEQFTTSGIESYALWPHLYTQDPLYTYVVVALTKDNQVIVTFMGEAKTFSRAWDLRNTSIYQVDKHRVQPPQFTKVKWSENKCQSTEPSLANKLSFVLMSSNFYSYLIEVDVTSHEGIKNATLKIEKAFAYYKGYEQFESAYDHCSELFISYVRSPNPREPDCILMIYPGNNKHASTFKIGNNSYNVIEVASAKTVGCPSSFVNSVSNLYLWSLARPDDDVSLSFALGDEIQTRYARAYYLPNTTNCSYNGTEGFLEGRIRGTNQFFSERVDISINLIQVPNQTGVLVQRSGSKRTNFSSPSTRMETVTTTIAKITTAISTIDVTITQTIRTIETTRITETTSVTVTADSNTTTIIPTATARTVTSTETLILTESITSVQKETITSVVTRTLNALSLTETKTVTVTNTMTKELSTAPTMTTTVTATPTKSMTVTTTVISAEASGTDKSVPTWVWGLIILEVLFIAALVLLFYVIIKKNQAAYQQVIELTQSATVTEREAQASQRREFRIVNSSENEHDESS